MQQSPLKGVMHCREKIPSWRPWHSFLNHLLMVTSLQWLQQQRDNSIGKVFQRGKIYSRKEENKNRRIHLCLYLWLSDPERTGIHPPFLTSGSLRFRELNGVYLEYNSSIDIPWGKLFSKKSPWSAPETVRCREGAAQFIYFRKSIVKLIRTPPYPQRKHYEIYQVHWASPNSYKILVLVTSIGRALRNITVHLTVRLPTCLFQ